MSGIKHGLFASISLAWSIKGDASVVERVLRNQFMKDPVPVFHRIISGRQHQPMTPDDSAGLIQFTQRIGASA